MKTALEIYFEHLEKSAGVLLREAYITNAMKEYAKQVGEAIMDECRKRVECLDIVPELITTINVEDFIK
jgi:hypothetical protein